MPQAEVPAQMYEQRDELRRRLADLESGVLHFRNGPELANDDNSKDAVEHVRRQLAEHEIMLAKFEEASRAQRS